MRKVRSKGSTHGMCHNCKRGLQQIQMLHQVVHLIHKQIGRVEFIGVFRIATGQGLKKHNNIPAKQIESQR